MALALAAALAACNPPSTPGPQKPLGPAGQQAAAQRLLAAFAGPCLTQPDPAAVTQALRASGWPRWITMWSEPGDVFYAAPGPPAELYVLRDLSWGGAAAQQLTCVGHYPAETDAPMVAAIEQRWGPGRDGVGPYAGARTWMFTTQAGVLTPVAATRGISPAEAAALAPGEAHIFIQVSYNRLSGEVASVIAVSRPGR